MKNVNWKELFIDIIIDIVAGMIIAVGIYNFALNADFPVAGFSGIAIIPDGTNIRNEYEPWLYFYDKHSIVS